MKYWTFLVLWCGGVVLARAQTGPGFALGFDGLNDNVSVAHTNTLDPYPLTVTAWFRTTQTSGQPGIVTKYRHTPFVIRGGWQVYLADGYIAGFYHPGAEVALAVVGGFVADGNWHHVAFRVDDAGAALFLDGVLQQFVPWDGAPAPAGSAVSLRIGSDGGSEFFAGTIDEVTTWNVAVGDFDIQSNMRRGLTGSEFGLVAYYRFNEGTGGTTADSAPVGGNNNGSLIGGPVWIAPVTTLGASSIASTTATLSGSVLPLGTNASAWFEWGATTNLGKTTPVQSLRNGDIPVALSAAMTNLGGGVTYYFRAVGASSTGIISGNVLSFTTPVFSKVNVVLPSSPFYSGSPAWVDYDNDGLLDFFFLTPTPQLFRNTGSGFTNVSLGLTNFTQKASWGDYDNDGRLDLLVGRGGGFEIARNTGIGFTIIEGAPMPPPGFGGTYSAAWGDFDNDGRLDVLMSAITNDFVDLSRWYEFTELWRNTGSGFVRVQTDLPTIYTSSLVDYDNDGRLDILFINNVYSSPQLWRNTGSNFVQAPLLIPPENEYAWVAVADYDNDGRMDLFLMGVHLSTNGDSQAVSELWRNTETGLTKIPIPGLTPVYGTAAWGDFDNDGRLDLLLTGTTNLAVDNTGSYYATNLVTQIWRNTGNGFVNINAGLPRVFASPIAENFALGDFDHDGRIDIALEGFLSLGINPPFITEIWRNNTPVSNTPPAAPASVSVTTTGNIVTLSWDAGSDAQTPAVGLTYALRIGTSPGGSDIVAPSAFSTGQRRIPQLGNAQNNRFWFSTALPLGQPLYWSVQSIDSAFAGSPFAPERTLKLLQPSVAIVPLTATNIVPGDANSNGVLDENELQAVLANYFANSPWLQMTNVAGLGGTNVTFALSNSLAGAFSVESSTNLSDWQFLGPAVSRYEFTDTNAPTQTQRYYRLRWP